MIHSRAGAMCEHVANPSACRLLQQGRNADRVADGDVEGFGDRGSHGCEMVGAAGDCTSNRFLMAWPLNKKTEKQPHAKCGARTVRVLPDASCLFLLLCPLTLAKPHAWSTSVFVDEVDPGGLKCAPYHFERGGTG